MEKKSKIEVSNLKRISNVSKRVLYTSTLIIMTFFVFYCFGDDAQQSSSTTDNVIPLANIQSNFATQFVQIWGIAEWIMKAILVITAACVAFKTATRGQGEDRAGGWIAVITILLVAIGISFVPDIAKTLFSIDFSGGQ